jgi:hypothetical protein
MPNPDTPSAIDPGSDRAARFEAPLSPVSTAPDDHLPYGA